MRGRRGRRGRRKKRKRMKKSGRKEERGRSLDIGIWQLSLFLHIHYKLELTNMTNHTTVDQAN